MSLQPSAVAYLRLVAAITIATWTLGALGGCSAEPAVNSSLYVFTNECAVEVIVFMANAESDASPSDVNSDTDFLHDNPRGSARMEPTSSGTFLGPEFIPGRTILVTFAVRSDPATDGGAPGTSYFVSNRLTEVNTGDTLLGGNPAVAVPLSGDMCPEIGAGQ